MVKLLKVLIIYQIDKQNISSHMKNIFDKEELVEGSKI